MKILFSWMWKTLNLSRSLRYLQKAWPFLFIQMLDTCKEENSGLIVCSGCEHLNVENTSPFSFLEIPGKSSTFFVPLDTQDVKSGKYSPFFVPSDTWDVKSEMARRYTHLVPIWNSLTFTWSCPLQPGNLLIASDKCLYSLLVITFYLHHSNLFLHKWLSFVSTSVKLWLPMLPTARILPYFYRFFMSCIYGSIRYIYGKPFTRMWLPGKLKCKCRRAECRQETKVQVKGHDRCQCRCRECWGREIHSGCVNSRHAVITRQEMKVHRKGNAHGWRYRRCRGKWTQ